MPTVGHTVTVELHRPIVLNDRYHHPGHLFFLHILADHWIDAARVVSHHRLRTLFGRHVHLR